MKVLVGTAGIPFSAKGTSTVGGVKRIKELGLQCMELSFVQQVYLNSDEAKKVGEVARQSGVSLSVHAPYYINLNSDSKVVEASKSRILQAAERGEDMGAKAVCIHAGYYGKSTTDETFENIKRSFGDILDRMREMGIKNIKLGVETMGKKSQFGSLDENIRLHKELKQVIPYIDFAHIFVRNGGKIDYAEILDKLGKLKLDMIFSHFEGMKWNESSESFVDVHVPIGDNPPFKPLAEEILKRKLDISIVCESPLLEEDALRMKEVLESLGHNFE